MIIEFGNSWSRLVKPTDKERQFVDGYVSCERRWRPGLDPNDRYSLLSSVGHVFPSGFTPMIAKAAREAGHDVTVDDQRGPEPCMVDDFADLAWLRGYQQEAVWEAAERGRGLIKVPTGGGKTEIFIGLTRALPCEWLFVVHRTDLVGQTAERFCLRIGETVGTFGGGRWSRGSANVTVSTFQSIARAIKDDRKRAKDFLDHVQALNVDEVHAQPAASFYRVTQAMVNARFRVGQSGTPLDRGEMDSLRTIGAIGPPVYQIDNAVLQAEGVLSKPEIYMPRLKQAGTTDCDWHTAYRQLIVESASRNDLLARLASGAAKPCMLFVDELDHGRDLEWRIRKLGLRVEFAHGDMSDAFRRGKLRLLSEAKIDVLICTVIFQEGIDVPELESVINGAGKASVVATLQRIGRGMRVAKGKSGFQVWDVKDIGQRWIEDHANDRLSAYRREGHSVKIGWP